MNEIEGLSLKENQFVADFYIWFRWHGDGFTPIETFEITNGRIDSKTEPYVGKRGNYNYAYQHIQATITQFWDVTRFPIDRHTLAIAIEDRDKREVRSSTSPTRRTPGSIRRYGFRVAQLVSNRAEVISQVYRSNFGDLDLPRNNESVYSRFLFSIPIARNGWGYFVKLLFGMFVATAIAFTAFLIEPSHFDLRFGLGVGAIFAAVASQYVVSSSLPPSQRR